MNKCTPHVRRGWQRYSITGNVGALFRPLNLTIEPITGLKCCWTSLTTNYGPAAGASDKYVFEKLIGSCPSQRSSLMHERTVHFQQRTLDMSVGRQRALNISMCVLSLDERTPSTSHLWIDSFQHKLK